MKKNLSFLRLLNLASVLALAATATIGLFTACAPVTRLEPLFDHTAWNRTVPVTFYANGSGTPLPVTNIQYIAADGTATTVSPGTPAQENDGTQADEAPLTFVVLNDVELSPDRVTPLLVYTAEYGYPVGAVYPATTTCTETGGWAAHLLWRLLTEDRAGSASGNSEPDAEQARIQAAQKYLAHFNWPRFLEEAETLAIEYFMEHFEAQFEVPQNGESLSTEECAGLSPAPGAVAEYLWQFDEALILNAIADGTFTKQTLTRAAPNE